MADRSMPWREKSERAVLAAAIHGAEDGGCARHMRDRLPVDAFHLPAHRDLWQVLTDLVDNGRPVDALSLADEAAMQSLWSRIGGAAYLSGLLDDLPLRMDADAHADMLLDAMRMRRWIEAERRAVVAAISGSTVVDVMRLDAEASKHLIAPARSQERGEALRAVLERGITRPVRVEIGSLGRMVGALYPGQIALIAGPTNAGKTGLMLAMALQAAMAGTRVGIIALEESQEELEVRLCAALAWVDIWRIQSKRMRHDKREAERCEEARQRIAALPLWIEWCPGADKHEVGIAIRQQVDGNAVAAVFVDYVQAIRGGRDEYEGIRGAMGEIERAIGRDAACFLGSQVNREGTKTGNPEIHQMRGAGTLEERARKVIIVSRGKTTENCEPGDSEDGQPHILRREVVLSVKKNKGAEGEVKGWSWGPKGIVWPGPAPPPWITHEQERAF